MKKLTLFIASIIFATAFFGGVLFIQQQATPELEIDTPPTTLSTNEHLPESTESIAQETSVATSNTQPDTPKLQTIERSDSVPASPKQTNIRQTTPIERTYYPLRTPNDPGYAVSNWALTAINAPAAWDSATGSNDTVIAVLDTGFALDHEDLSAAWHENTGETGTTIIGGTCWTGTPADKSTNNCDDDQNGYIDDWRGWDFFDGTNNPMAGQNNPLGDGVSHGTEVAGLVGAVGNNGIGIATVNWAAKMMPLKVLSDDGPGYTSDIAAAIYYAVDNGADIINLSLGGNEPDATMLAATNYAYNNDVLVIAAAGNCGTGTEDGCEGYPAGIIGYPARNPHVISVGATTNSTARASFSSYGDALDIVAPGSGAIYSPTWTPENGVEYYATSLYGTSFAAPIVSSLASLILSERPDASVDDLTALLLASTQKTNVTNGVYSTQLGHGLIDAANTVGVANALNATNSTPTLYQTGSHKNEHNYRPNSTMGSGCAVTATNSYCTVRFTDDSTKYERFLPYKQASDTYGSWSWNTAILGSSTWTMHAVQGGVQSSSYIISVK